MRSTWKALAAAVATALNAPQLANADDVEERLRQMQERMDQLEDQLAATNDQLEASTARVEQQLGGSHFSVEPGPATPVTVSSAASSRFSSRAS